MCSSSLATSSLLLSQGSDLPLLGSSHVSLGWQLSYSDLKVILLLLPLHTVVHIPAASHHQGRIYQKFRTSGLISDLQWSQYLHLDKILKWLVYKVKFEEKLWEKVRRKKKVKEKTTWQPSEIFHIFQTWLSLIFCACNFLNGKYSVRWSSSYPDIQ
jgi:hypothetical protein